MIERIHFLVCSWVILFLTITGCAKLERSYPERYYYILNASRNYQKSSSVSGAVLEIQRFTISPGFAGREFVYRKGDMSYVSDFYNQFFRPPALLITDEAHKWFSESDQFSHVMDSNNYVEPDYILEGNINELYGDYRISNTPKAVMMVQFLLTDVGSANPQIIFQSNYQTEVALRSDSPEELVKGWNEALEQILTDLEGDLKKLNLTKSQYDNQF